MITLSSEKIKHYLKNSFNLTTNYNNLLYNLINSYYNYVDSNSFEDLKCPYCNHYGCLIFYKTYNRNLCYYENNQLITITIYVAVLKCNFCLKHNNKQKYHALLPDFILPYHIYEFNTIIASIYDRFINNIKIQIILDKLQITHKSFYDWIKKFKKYLLPSSIILKTKNSFLEILKKIYLINKSFLIDFYLNYNHPYFLFKSTCVPLCIIP